MTAENNTFATGPDSYRFETKQLHVGQESPDSATGARAVPIYQTTSYVFDSPEQAAARFSLQEGGYIYTRLNNPTTNVLEERIAALEGGAAALAVASGSAATTYAFLNICDAGDHIVSARSVYGGTYNLFAHTFPRLGITTTFVDLDPAAFEAAIQPNTKALFVESLDNPHANVADIEALSEIAHRHQIPLIVDNTLATPFLIRPIEHGADIVIHSATKFIGGNGTTIGGLIVDGGKFDWAASGKFPQLSQPEPSYGGAVFTDVVGPIAYIIRLRVTLLRDTGAALSPFNAWLLSLGLETLSLRVERHVQNALKVVEFLNSHPKVERVNHPSLPGSPTKDTYDRYFRDGVAGGAGSIFTFEVAGGYEGAKRVGSSIKLFSFLANVADAKSLIIHPASTTHSQLTPEEGSAAGIHPNTLRVSIGLEHIDDIIAALSEALDAV